MADRLRRDRRGRQLPAYERFLVLVDRVISGGQTGADIAGLKAAKAFGIPTGGYMTSGFRTLDGYKPEYHREYNVIAIPVLVTVPELIRMLSILM